MGCVCRTVHNNSRNRVWQRRFYHLMSTVESNALRSSITCTTIPSYEGSFGRSVAVVESGSTTSMTRPY